MSRGHKGRCFRSHRRTIERKAEQGERFDYPIRYKVPQVISFFLSGGQKNQRRAQHDQFGLAIARYAEHQRLTGKGPAVRAAGQGAR